MLFALGKYKPSIFSKDFFSYIIWKASDIDDFNKDYEKAALNIIKSAREWKEVAEHMVVIKDGKYVYYHGQKVLDISRFMYGTTFLSSELLDDSDDWLQAYSHLRELPGY